MVLAAIAKAIFGSANDRQVKKYLPRVVAINALEPQFEKLTDEELRAKTQEFRDQLAAGKTLDDILSRPLPWCAKAPSARSACAISTCS